MAALRSPIVGYGFLARWEQKQAAPSRLARSGASQSMEQVVIAPPEIIDAIDRGDLEEIKAWVAAGGDPNAKMTDSQHAARAFL